MFGLDRTSRRNREIKELQITMAAQIVRFAATVTEEFEPWATEEPSYRRLFSSHQPNDCASHLNQMALAVGGLCFFLHALDRMSYRADSEKLREAVFDPCVHGMVSLVAKMLETQSEKVEREAWEGGVLDHINIRNAQYAALPSLLGRTPEDHVCARWTAARTIAEDVGHPKHAVLVYRINNALMQGLLAADLANRVRRIDALL